MKFNKIKEFFMGAAFEYSIVFFFLIYLLIHDSIGLPSIPELISLIEKGFQHYGLVFLFFGLMIEGLFVVGLYFPGSVIAFSAVVFLGKTLPDVLLIILIGSLSLVAVSFINYWLGRYGYYKIFKKLGAEKTLQRMENRFNKNYKKTIIIFSSSPNFLAIASVYAGIARVKLGQYIAFISACVVFWVSVVSLIIYFSVSSEKFITNENLGWYAFAILLAWALFESISFIRSNKLAS